MIYKIATKSSIVLVLALLWDRFVNISNRMSLRKDVFFIIGLIWMLFAWFQYLKLDGYTIQYVFRDKRERKVKKHIQKDIVDFVDEKIISFGELEEDEKVLVNLLSNVITGLIYVLISVV
jgi:hypothetical protein